VIVCFRHKGCVPRHEPQVGLKYMGSFDIHVLSEIFVAMRCQNWRFESAQTGGRKGGREKRSRLLATYQISASPMLTLSPNFRFWVSATPRWPAVACQAQPRSHNPQPPASHQPTRPVTVRSSCCLANPNARTGLRARATGTSTIGPLVPMPSTDWTSYQWYLGGTSTRKEYQPNTQFCFKINIIPAVDE
jgi:hypothetical protein